MTISTSVNKATAQGNGATTAFNYSFLMPLASDAIVTVVDNLGNQSVLGTTQYSLTGIGNPSGGTLNYPLIGSPLASGWSITLQRILPLQQLVSVINQAGFFPAVYESALDNLEMQIQQIAASTGGNYSIQFPAADPNTLNAVLPAAAARANGTLTFDSLGNVIVSSPASGSAASLASNLLNSVSSILGAAMVGFNVLLGYAANTLGWAVQVSTNNSLKLYGAKGDGVTDDTTAINSWLATGGGYAPPGTYLHSAALNVTVAGTQVIGAGGGRTQFLGNSATAHMFNCSAGLLNVLFEEFSCWSTVTKSAGAVFLVATGGRYEWRKVVAADRSLVAANGNRFFRGIDFQGCDDSNILSCQIAGYSSDAVRVYGSGAFSSELHITGGTRISQANIGVHVAGNFGGMYFGAVSIDGCVKDVVVDQSAAATINREIFLGADTVLDTCNDTCLEVQANGCTYLDLSGAWVASAGQFGTPSGNKVGCNILATNGGLQFVASGTRFFGCLVDGLQVNSAASVDLANNSYTSNGANGLNLAGGASIGGVVSRGGKANANVTGLRIAAATPAFNIDGLDLSTGNTTAAVNSAGYSATQSIRNCPGFVTENSGSAVVLSTTTSIAFNHGLSSTPPGGAILVCPLTSPGTTQWYIDPSSFTSSQATIRTVGAAAANISFMWRASLNVYA